MKVFVFKPSNRALGHFKVDKHDTAELERALADFSKDHPVGRFDYLEASGYTWTVTGVEDGFQIQEGRVLPEPKAPPIEKGRVPPAKEKPPKLEECYHQRYQRADFVIKAGKVLKIAGIVMAVIAFLFPWVSGSEFLVGMGRGGRFIYGMFAGITAGAPLYIAGIVVGILGEMQKTNLDTTVTGSLLLTEEEKKRVVMENRYP